MINKTKLWALLLLVSLTGIARAQEFKPEQTEIWEPEPKKIQPGDLKAPPSDAIVLFDGNNLEQWESVNGGEAKWKVEDGAMTVVAKTGPVQTKQSFGDAQIHIEWRAPSEVKGEGQGRGNSGIFLQKRYELQVLDSYNNRTYSNGQAGSIYKQTMPLVNATKAPGEWQTYDIIYTAPVFKEDGSVKYPARITVLHNGIVIQNNTEIKGNTEYIGLPSYKEHGDAPLMLQDHGNPVSYRNIWIRPL
ncbi:MAG: 3-keto-disaccharide hydrolase [Candidatus Cyclobacteriaceae bacterium M3_2C_046]